jgi:ferredoxin
MADISSCIYWFSGTGNSLYAAKRLSAEMGGYPLVQITDDAPEGAVGGAAATNTAATAGGAAATNTAATATAASGAGAGAKIGFVFPSYYSNLPRAVHAFVEKLEITPGAYIFAIVTMGAVGQGSVYAMDKALKAKGLRLDYGRGILMPANYVISYNPADGDKKAKALDKADERLSLCAREISAMARSVKALPLTAKNLFNDIEKLDAAFAVNGDCTGCGLCERICPVRNIRLESGKPKWLHRCERCVACISWCPAKAINHGNNTQGRRRYCNPRIAAEDLVRQERKA